MNNDQSQPIPEAIKNLRLCGAFKGYAVPIMDCIELSKEKQVLLVDDDYTHITKNIEDEPRACIVRNDSGGLFVVLSIDHRLISQREGGMADGAVFNTNNFAFIEFKDKAQGNLQSSIEATYKKASSQLHEALILFSEKISKVGLVFGRQVNRVCHIIVHETFPRSSTLENDMMVLFLEDNKVPLSFEREIVI